MQGLIVILSHIKETRGGHLAIFTGQQGGLVSWISSGKWLHRIKKYSYTNESLSP